MYGYVNIPAMTRCEEVGGCILCGGKPICISRSENAHQFFSRNDDGQGMRRGKLTQAIQGELRKRDKNHQVRWDKVWDDPVCRKYRRTETDDYFLWNHDFFSAPIQDLVHIANLIGIKEVNLCK